jgi:O-acetyl-ADP-ribose deacetylase (regulator of RNase III)
VEIEYVTGNILDGDEEYLVQGCNAQGVMGSGLAKTIRGRYPQVFRQYNKVYQDQGDYLDLGQLIYVDVGTRYIVNAITQQNFGRDPNEVYVSYDAMQTAIKTLNEDVGDPDKPPRIAFPLIGAGLANGSWKTISEIIEDYSTDFIPVVYLLDGEIPEG